MAALCLCAAAAAPAARAQAPEPAEPPSGDLTELSIEELMSIEVTSVSKRAESISQAAAAVHVITQEDLRRSGATSLPEALRLVPGLQVARATSSVWAISGRGFNGRFANKLLVLVDGRSVYTPLFSGVFWDVQGVPLEDVERIEVVRGPGAALWGANAVNGVINVLTKDARHTRGTLARLTAGSEIDALAAVRHGGGDDRTAWRVFAERSDRDGGELPGRRDAGDDWALTRGGFRLDHAPAAGGRFTVQGGGHDGESGELLALGGGGPGFGSPEPARVENDLRGGHLLGRWTRPFSPASELTVQAYVDRTDRAQPILAEDRTTWDLDLQHSLSLRRHEIVWGAGYRRTRDELRGSELISFAPRERTDELLSAFVQDQVAVVPERLWITLGTKLEENDYTGFELQPSLRGLWIPRTGHTLWAALSRAVRTPSRAEADIALVTDRIPPDTLFPGAPPAVAVVSGSDAFDSEVLVAVEAGYRVGLGTGLYLDVAAFHDDYSDLRDVVTLPAILPARPGEPIVVPSTVVNRMEGTARGLEVSADWWPADRWRLTAAWTWLDLDLETGPPAALPLPGAPPPPDPAEVTEGDSPEHQLVLRSSWDLGRGVEADVVARWVDELTSQGVDDYVEADVLLGWRARSGLVLELAGRNLLHDSHREFVPEIIPTAPTEVERSVHATLAWRFRG